jgi:hypothetical protein
MTDPLAYLVTEFATAIKRFTLKVHLISPKGGTFLFPDSKVLNYIKKNKVGFSSFPQISYQV